MIGRLLAPDITAQEYRAILQAYLSFYQDAEAIRKRYALMPALSFAPDLARIHSDLGVKQALPPPALPISSSLQTLGMLYVLHGSRFGAVAIYRNLRVAMPHQAHAFFCQRPNKSIWHALLERMEEQQGRSAEISEIAEGSAITFDTFDKWLLLAISSQS
ncbi:biliverdin-producing heme oxygenase [Yoonia sp. F2084L]|uniref:biliverdin-producing heme oxygenase n=1 Tax=Yoonia sp. F2084L TaxID=2926419 RepID=UPI001FF24FC0|nr:biliverdin-producing heme oxygenase [Yoonia sp. F2084L]